MPSLSISPNSLLVIVSAAGTGMDSDIKKAISPKNILEHIINFFTFGGVTRENKKNYLHILELMTNALAQKKNQIGMDTSLHLNDINGCQVSFTPSETDHNYITIEVKKGDYSERYNINSNKFIKVCQALEMRNELGIPQDPIILTECGKINLRGVDLSFKDLSHKNLRNVDFTGSYLYRTNLFGADLTKSLFSDATLTHCIFSYSTLKGAVFSGAEASHSFFSGADLINADLSNGNFSYATFSEADLSGTDASFANLFRADFRNADFTKVNLTCANLKKATVEPDFLTDVSEHPGAQIDNLIYANTLPAQLSSMLSPVLPGSCEQPPSAS
ncbi:pentapeptide repeat-containing protein [Salmonella enterica]|nr:pentapeptide repeat-containing protein [Salmonella enterica]EKS4853623.1 pentapeptide repeat-containing protein [Salmonella enterica]